jgi:tripeptide aminopeptidase
MDLQTLLHEGILAKFVRYAREDSQSQSGTGTVPSTPCQLELGKMLLEELKTLGLADATMDEFGFVTATLPASSGKEGTAAIGYLAHMDTVPGIPAVGVKPQVIENYQGGVITLASGDVIDPATCKPLQQAIGHTLVTSDGTTLLGADNKSGVAAIMEAVCRLLKNPELIHGPFKVAFTVDEEIGSGIGHFDVKRFGAVAAYTVDGGALGDFQAETFNAYNVTVKIMGKSSHPGSAKGNMINAMHMAAQLWSAIPANMRPETTDGYDGFIHPGSVKGTAESIVCHLIIRDFTTDGLKHKVAWLEAQTATLESAYPGSSVKVIHTGGYRNMFEILKEKPEIVNIARTAMKNCGIEPLQSAVRGGTDGSQLTFMGLPTPNLFCGGVNAHARTEWTSVQFMEKATDMIVEIARLWSMQ